MAISRSMIAVFRLSDMQRVFFHRLVSPPPPTAALSGEYKKPAVEILADARKAGAQARSFHMVGFAKGAHPDDRGQMVFALTIAAHQGGEGTITSGGQTWSIIRLGSALYLKSSDAVYRKVFGDKAKGLFGKWLTVNANTPSWRNYTTLTEPGFTNTLSIRDGKPEKDALTTLNGTPAIKLVFPDGYQLYVAAKGPPYPLLGTDPIDPRARTFRFSRWNAKVTITAPASSTTLNH
jgi:hypothetical protein